MVRCNAAKRRFSGSVSTLDIGPPQKLHRTHGRRQFSGLVGSFDTGPPQKLHRTHGRRQFHGFVGILDTGHRKSPYQYSLNAPLKKSRPMKTGLQNRVVG